MKFRKSTFSFSRDVYKQKDVEYTFTFCTVNCFTHVCYTCLFTSIKIKRFKEDLLNETLRPNCHDWLSDSYISRVQKTAKTCFHNLKVYLEVNDYNANFAMSVCCFECFKQLICSFLYDDFFTLDCWRMFIRICSLVLIKILSNAKTNNRLAFTFSLSFVFGVYVVHCVLSYFYGKKEENNS